MNYREQLSRPLSSCFLDQLVQEVLDTPSDFQQVYRLVFDADSTVAWRAAWACVKISEHHPTWFSDQQVHEIISLSLVVSHGGVHRGCLSILSRLPLPNPIPVEFINSCFEWMLSPKSPIAVQALSMKLLYAVCQQEPDFIPELKAYLQNIDFECYSAGFNSTRRNIIKRL